MIKKFTTFLLAFAIVLSVSTPKSSAAGGAIGTVVAGVTKTVLAHATLELALKAVNEGLEDYFSSPQTKAFVENLIAEGIFTVADYIAAGFTDQDIYDQFTNYNAQLETVLGTTSISNGGLVFYGDFVSADGSPISYWAFTKNDTSPLSNNAYWYSQPSVHSSVAPITGYYTYFVDLSGVNVNFEDFNGLLYNDYMSVVMDSQQLTRFNNTYVVAGDWLNAYGADRNPNYVRYFKVSTAKTGDFQFFSFNLRYGWKVVPVDDELPSSIDLTAPSRPTSLVTPIAIQNPDQTYTVYNNITLVDEGNKVVFDPTTGESITFTDWVYDYESRTYDLTLDGGGNMTVQFGNDSITMTQGDTVTNIFYVQDPADDPGTDDPDNPGTDADVSGFFAWWKNAWNGFVDRLFTVLDGGDLEVILPGEEGNPEDEEDDGWTVFDLFALIRDALWKIITGVITVVLDGFLGLVDAIVSLGDFFDIYDPANPDGIFGVPGGGVDLWS